MNVDSKCSPPGPGALNSLNSLRRFVRPRAARERCELCGVGLAAEHTHLVEVASRRLACSCDACDVLFSGQAAGRYRRVPRRAQLLPAFRLTDEAWAGLQLPIDLAFFLHSTPAGRVVALYPGPAGATEAAVPPEAWEALAAENPVLRELEPDVEALLVNRVCGTRECYRAGVDRCYKLVGLIRTHWRGLSGGDAVWHEIGRFFAAMKERAGAEEAASHEP
jgi:Family of unknown function (DUF5947)